MKRSLLVPALVACVALAAGCGGGSSGAASSSSFGKGKHEPITLTVWSGFTAPAEKRIFDQGLNRFHLKYPWITVKSIGSDSNTLDQRIIKAVKGGDPPDVILSFGPDYVGQYCSSGTLMDLEPYIERDHVDTSQFPKAAFQYTRYQGKQCALPELTDAYGLYYNKDLFAKAGISSPPKTLSELMADAKKLTQRNADGSIKVLGFMPVGAGNGGYGQIGVGDIAHAYGAKWFSSPGQPAIATDPAWAQAFQWEKQMVDYYGFDNLTKFVAGLGDEFSASQGFEVGKVAMMFDGEWRVAFIKREHPELNYGTTFFPAADDHPEMYGSGRIGGSIMGVPKGSAHPEEAWQLVKFMATDTKNLVDLANELGNVPTTVASLHAKLNLPPTFGTFLKVFANPNSAFYPPLTAGGSGYATPLNNYEAKWVAGNGGDLTSGLQNVASQMKDQLQLGQGPP